MLGLKWIIARLEYALGSSITLVFSSVNDNKVQVMRVDLESVKHFPTFITIIVIEKKTFTLSGSNWGMRVIFAPIERGA